MIIAGESGPESAPKELNSQVSVPQFDGSLERSTLGRRRRSKPANLANLSGIRDRGVENDGSLSFFV